MDYVRDTMDWLMGKGRRKADKDPPTPDGTPGPPYLEPSGARLRLHFATPTLLPAYVRLPQGVDLDEWLATHTISFFEHVNLVYSCLSEYCTVADCSSMTGPQQSQYHWIDEKGKKFKYPAPRYVDFVMSFIHKMISDESIFPTKYGNTFPPTFLALIKKAWRYLFHVMAHMYAAHFVEIRSLDLHPHFHTLFVHFSVFNKEFGLVEEEETRVLDDLLDLLLSEGLSGSSPVLSTSQSDGALNSRSRSEEALLGSGSAGALSLPPSSPPPVSLHTGAVDSRGDARGADAAPRLSPCPGAAAPCHPDPPRPHPAAALAAVPSSALHPNLPPPSEIGASPFAAHRGLPSPHARSNSGGTTASSSKSRSSSGHSVSGSGAAANPLAPGGLLPLSLLPDDDAVEDKENFSPIEDLDVSADGLPGVESMDVTLSAAAAAAGGAGPGGDADD